MNGQVIFQLLKILREETDEQHRLSQQMLAERMKERFGISMNRRTLKGYLDKLLEAGYPLNSTSFQRTQPDGSSETIRTDWYLEPMFEISELRLLCDMLAAMPAIPQSQRDSLMQKLMSFAPPTFRNSQQTKEITYLHTPPAKQLLFSIEQLCEAIRRKCMVSFQYNCYKLDENGAPIQAPRLRENGTVREYVVSPYEIVVSHGRYYLLCCKEPYNQISNYRIDRMTEMKVLEKFPQRPLSDTEGTKFPQKLAEQLYMYCGNEETVTFIAEMQILGDVLDWFGTDLQMKPAERVNTVEITVQVHPTAMLHWAMQYGKYVTVMKPESLREEIAQTAREIMEKHN